jgi:hypothetical protein
MPGNEEKGGEKRQLEKKEKCTTTKINSLSPLTTTNKDTTRTKRKKGCRFL